MSEYDLALASLLCTGLLIKITGRPLWWVQIYLIAANIALAWTFFIQDFFATTFAFILSAIVALYYAVAEYRKG